MFRFLLFLLGSVTAGGPRPGMAWYRQAGAGTRDGREGTAADPAQRPAGGTWPLPHPGPARAGARAQDYPRQPVPGPAGRPPRRRVPRWLRVVCALTVLGLVFRRAVAAIVLATLSAALHLVGVDIHLPSVRFAWPWQTISAGTTANTDLGPWVLQKIQGISRPALGVANFSFDFTHTVSKNIGPWPCWYASTFHAVGRASATVDLNPGPAWWRPSAGHYRLLVLSRPWHAKPGHVTVTMVLPRPQLPRSANDVSINDIPSKPIATDHSWTYPGLGCGLVLRPQFPESVLYSQAQQIAFYKAGHAPDVTGPLIRSAEQQATRTVRDNFIQPTVNAFGYTLDRFSLRWAAGP